MFKWLKWFRRGAVCTMERAKEHFKMTDDEVAYIEKCHLKGFVVPMTENGEEFLYVAYKVWDIRWKLFVRRYIVMEDPDQSERNELSHSS